MPNLPPDLTGNIAILIVAAGASSRMRGADKLLTPIGGEALLTRQASRALATGCPVHAVLRPGDNARRAALPEGVAIIEAAEAHEGLSASLRAGIAALGAGVEAAMILLADMPEITTEDMSSMIAAFRQAPDQPLLRATAEDGTPGHPVLFPRRFFDDLCKLTGDSGARDLLRRQGRNLRPIALPARHALTDLDTPEDWENWISAQGR